MTLAKDIMTKNVITIKPHTSILEAIDLLLENGISGVPVVDDEMHVCGLLSEKDLLNILFEKDVNVDTPVDRFMSKDVIEFKAQDKAIDICSFFLESAVRRVPIVENDKLVGVISRRDMLKMITATVLSMSDDQPK